MSNITKFEPATGLRSGNKVSAIVPRDYQETASLAQMIYASGLAPRGFDSPQKIAVAIMLGAELGLTPMMAINRIAVVNGRPAPYGDAVVAIVRRSGLCEYIEETLEGEGDARVAICETKRKGESRPVIRKFGVADAKRARLWGKAGPWQDYPERMLAMRARSFALRDTYGDLLSGTYDAEEAADIPPEAGTVMAQHEIVGPEPAYISGPELIDSEQIMAIEEKIKEVGADKSRFMTFFKVNSLTEITADRYDDAMACLNAKKKGAA